MHDTVIALKIMADAKLKVKGRKVKGVTLTVGELAPSTPKELQRTLETLSGWKVKTKVEKAAVKCSCGFRGKPKMLERGHDFVLYICPKCGKVPAVEKGGGIVLSKVTV